VWVHIRGQEAERRSTAAEGIGGGAGACERWRVAVGAVFSGGLVLTVTTMSMGRVKVLDLGIVRRRP
jgi:hypothetical protein